MPLFKFLGLCPKIDTTILTPTTTFFGDSPWNSIKGALEMINNWSLDMVCYPINVALRQIMVITR